MQNQSLLPDPKMIRDEVRELKKLNHTIKVVKLLFRILET